MAFIEDEESLSSLIRLSQYYLMNNEDQLEVVATDEPARVSAIDEPLTPTMSPIDSPRFKIPRKPISQNRTSCLSSAETLVNNGEKDFSVEPGANLQSGTHLGALRIWWLELVCSGIAVGALLGMAAVIKVHQDRPLPDWPKSITINSMISIFAVVLKSSLMLVVSQGLSQLKWTWFSSRRPLQDLVVYDEASRSPWGAAKLLLAIKHKQLASSLAALVVIAALALDPLAQQIVRSYDCLEPLTSSTALLPRTRLYDEYGDMHLGGEVNSLTADQIAAISSASSGIDTVPLPFNCPTGTCQFPGIYSTVGLCSSCEDISSQLRLEHMTETEVVISHNESYRYYNLTLPSGTFAITGTMELPATPLVLRATNNADDLSLSIEIVYLDSEFGTNQTAAALKQCGICPSDRTNSTDWCCRGFGAANCHVTPCVQSYKGAVIAGNLSETVSSSTYSWGGLSDDNLAMIDLKCLTSTERGQLLQEGYTFDKDALWVAANYFYSQASNTTASEGSPFPNIPANVGPNRCLYQFDVDTAVTLTQFLVIFFTGTIELAPEFLEGPYVLQYLFNSGVVGFNRVDRYFESFSGSMTRYMRQNGGSNFSDPITGTVISSQTCLEARWAWFLLPLTLVVLVFGFLVTTMIQTLQHQRGYPQDFKSSPLALLFHGFDRETQDSFGNMGKSNEVGHLTQDAKQIVVRFEPTGSGWKFVDAAADQAWNDKSRREDGSVTTTRGLVQRT